MQEKNDIDNFTKSNNKVLKMNLDFKSKKPTYKALALYLGVTESAIKQYDPKKRYLMILGLWLELEMRLKNG